ncbi:Hypothetical predicted protein [Mytilus galloprovincialis]|uniref:Endonuclease/exonuclease/phosphatase domain-containing protein n=1 Tax=Mytilus galloprovincialis TaxID=29158 RepID=A0A8B6DEF4_MYTGA|nr:Hypothetical predicted protein [Mytilus galloprovincialis]
METQQESAKDTSWLKGTVRLGHLNVCSLTLNNDLLQKGIVENIKVDILSICETHLKENNKIAVDVYTWKGNNRNKIHRNAPKASGGVGLVIKQWILEEFKYETIDMYYEGILCAKFTSTNTNYSFLLLSCELPFENSVWGRDSQGFFAQILSNILKVQYSYDAIFVCGDFNSRIGNLSDFTEFDDAPTHFSLDGSTNQHGKAFLEFLNESKMCV